MSHESNECCYDLIKSNASVPKNELCRGRSSYSRWTLSKKLKILQLCLLLENPNTTHPIIITTTHIDINKKITGKMEESFKKKSQKKQNGKTYRKDHRVLRQ